MTIIEKIYFRGYAWHFLEWAQYTQLVTNNRLILAPYYRERLIKQAKEVQDSENFKASHNGKTRYQFENNI